MVYHYLNDNNIHPILRYYLIWQGLANIIGFRLDHSLKNKKNIYKMNTDSDENINLIVQTICDMCSEQMIDRFIHFSKNNFCKR